jgi:opacity protein-like surface antigen
MRLKVCVSVAALLLMSVVLLGSVAAQTTGDAAPEKLGNYLATGDFEVGYRFNAESGDQVPCAFGTINRSSAGLCPNESMYDTLVNLHTGGRLLDQTLSLRAPDHNGGIFDDLSISSFGWGDPNAVARVRASKHKLYDFNATYRQDRNFFDYDLLANPLNPAGSPFTVGYSPHTMDLAHRMSDFNLTVLPESAISFRLGYSRNRTEGPAFSTLHEGEESLLLNDVSTTTDNYRFGVDYRPLKHTKISFDEILQWYRGDTTASDQNLYFTLPNGTMTDLGIDFTPPSTMITCMQTVPVTASCIKTLNGSSQTTSYARSNRVRTHTPTEQLSLESYNKKWDVTGRASYSGNDMAANYNEFFTGVTRGALDQLLMGPQNGKWIQDSADLGVTYHVTDKFSVKDTFHIMNWRSPAFFNSDSVNFNPPASGVATPAGCSSTACVLFPIGSTLQAATATMYSNFLQQNSKWNLLQADYDFSRMFGVHAGYRYDHAAVVNATDSLTGVTSTVTNAQTIISTDTGLVGFWLRPNSKLRANADLNIGTADNWEYRTDPRRTMEYKGRLIYTPTRWATLTALGNAQEQRNRGNDCDPTGAFVKAPCNSTNPVLGTGEVDYNAHNRNVGFGATFMPNEKFGFDLAYNYSNIASNSFICYDITAPGAVPPTANCVGNTVAGVNGGANVVGGNLYETYEIYSNRVHYADATVLWKPIPRVSANMGYSIVSSQGNTTTFNPLQPLGSLASNFHRPIFALEVKMAKNWAAKAGWNYYGYNEKDVAGPTLPRDFHDNMTTLSLKYAF